MLALQKIAFVSQHIIPLLRASMGLLRLVRSLYRLQPASRDIGELGLRLRQCSLRRGQFGLRLQ